MLKTTRSFNVSLFYLFYTEFLRCHSVRPTRRSRQRSYRTYGEWMNALSYFLNRYFFWTYGEYTFLFSERVHFTIFYCYVLYYPILSFNNYFEFEYQIEFIKFWILNLSNLNWIYPIWITKWTHRFDQNTSHLILVIILLLLLLLFCSLLCCVKIKNFKSEMK